MANKSLNSALDDHFTKVNTGCIKVKVAKADKPVVEKPKGHVLKSIKCFFKRVKNYLFPGIQFESVDIMESGTTIVSSVERGIKKHFLAFIGFFRRLFTRREKVVVEEPEDVDMSAIKDDLKHNKIKHKKT